MLFSYQPCAIIMGKKNNNNIFKNDNNINDYNNLYVHLTMMKII